LSALGLYFCRDSGLKKNNSKNEEKRLFLHGFRTQKEQFKK
jgi:hypothetical protein